MSPSLTDCFVLIASCLLQHGEVVFRLCKAHPYNPFSGIEWQLWDALDPSIPRVNVKKAFLRGNTLFETVDGVPLTHMTQKLGDAFSEMQWDDCAYRRGSITLFACFALQACSPDCYVPQATADILMPLLYGTAPNHSKENPALLH